MGISKYFFIPDTHVPEHDEIAWTCCLNAVKSWKPKRVCLLGDFAETKCVSKHKKSPKYHRILLEEFEPVNTELDRLEDVQGEAVDVLGGNHENRVEAFIDEQAPQFHGITSIPQLLKIKERGWRYADYGDVFKYGKLHATHDVGRCGKNAARQSLEDYGHSLIFGHSHGAAVIYMGTVAGERRVCVNSGWLGDINKIKYTNRNIAKRAWQLGFTIAEIDDRTGVAWVNFIPIIDGRCIIGGKMISGRKRAA